MQAALERILAVNVVGEVSRVASVVKEVLFLVGIFAHGLEFGSDHVGESGAVGPLRQLVGELLQVAFLEISAIIVSGRVKPLVTGRVEFQTSHRVCVLNFVARSVLIRYLSLVVLSQGNIAASQDVKKDVSRNHSGLLLITGAQLRQNTVFAPVFPLGDASDVRVNRDRSWLIGARLRHSLQRLGWGYGEFTSEFLVIILFY